MSAVESSGVTKGALYFDSKKALAQAMIGGKVRRMVVDNWLGALLGGAIIDLELGTVA